MAVNNVQNNGVGTPDTSAINQITPDQLKQIGEVMIVEGISALLASSAFGQGQGAWGALSGSGSGVSSLGSPSSSGSGGMTTSPDGTISFPDGTKICQDGQYNWSVHNPDGTTTAVTGDPHVDDGKGHKWDFQE